MFFAYWDDPQGMPRLALLGGGREEAEARLKGLYHEVLGEYRLISAREVDLVGLDEPIATVLREALRGGDGYKPLLRILHRLLEEKENAPALPGMR